MSSYLLIPMRRYDSTQKGIVFQIGERTQWKIALAIGFLTAGASITVVLQTGPTAEEQDLSTLVSFGLKSATGLYTLDGAKSTTPDFTITPRKDVWMRAIITTISGQAAVEVVADAPFFNTAAPGDLKLLSKELRGWDDGLERTLEQAEKDIVGGLIYSAEYGDLDVDLSIPGVHRLIQEEIAEQAEHIMKREVLSRSHESSVLVTLRSMPRLFSGNGVRLRKYRSQDSYVWYGR